MDGLFAYKEMVFTTAFDNEVMLLCLVVISWRQLMIRKCLNNTSLIIVGFVSVSYFTPPP